MCSSHWLQSLVQPWIMWSMNGVHDDAGGVGGGSDGAFMHVPTGLLNAPFVHVTVVGMVAR
jgi:hypothetical protein